VRLQRRRNVLGDAGRRPDVRLPHLRRRMRLRRRPAGLPLRLTPSRARRADAGIEGQ